VQKDTQKPQGVTLKVNGVTVATGLFPNPTGSDIAEVDITTEVLNKAGGFRTWHNIELSAALGRGDVSVVFFIDVEVGTVRV
jgi:hypothetical protein